MVDSKFTPRETGKTWRIVSQALQASVILLKVKVHGKAIRKRLNKHGWFGRIARRNFRLSKKNMAAQLGLLEQCGAKWRCLAVMHKTTFGSLQSCQRRHMGGGLGTDDDDLDLFCMFSMGLGHLGVIELNWLWIHLYTKVKHEAICQTAEAWLKRDFQCCETSCSHACVLQSINRDKLFHWCSFYLLFLHEKLFPITYRENLIMLRWLSYFFVLSHCRIWTNLMLSSFTTLMKNNKCFKMFYLNLWSLTLLLW